LLSFFLLGGDLLLDFLHHFLEQSNQLLLRLFPDLLLVIQGTIELGHLRLQVVRDLPLGFIGLLLLLGDELLQLREVALQTLLDVLDTLEAVLRLHFDVHLYGSLLLRYQLRDLFADVLPALLSSFEPRLESSLSVLDLLSLSLEQLLLAEAVPVEEGINLSELVVEQDVEPFLGVVDHVVELVFQLEYLHLVLLDFMGLSHFNLLFNRTDLFMQPRHAVVQAVSARVLAHGIVLSLVVASSPLLLLGVRTHVSV